MGAEAETQVETKTKPSSPKELFTFEAGDREILVNYHDETIAAKVSSQAMSLASPVWRKFVSPPWQSPPQPEEDSVADSGYQSGSEAAAADASVEANKQQQLDFTDDNGNALLILLNIAHLKFARVPSKLAYNQLLNVAILVDQYDCGELVRPWLKSWLEDEESQSQIDGQENWLFIAWVFGREDVFEKLARTMVRNVSIGSDGGPRSPAFKAITQPMPSDILGR